MFKQYSLISWFTKNPVAANLLMAIVIVMGINSASSLRKEAFPNKAPDTVEVSVHYPSGSAQQAEQGIALVIESALQSVTGVKRITSSSNAQGTSVMIEKTAEHDLNQLLQDVKAQVDAIHNFPTDAEKPLVKAALREEQVIRVQLFGDVPHQTLQLYGDKVANALLAKPAIGKVIKPDHREPLIAIEIDEAALKAYRLTFTEVAKQVNEASGVSVTKSLRNPEKVLRLSANIQAMTVQDFAQLVVKSNQVNSYVTLADIATITDTYNDEQYFLSRFDGHNAYTIKLVMDEYGDMEQIVAQAQQVVAQFQSTLPDTIQLATWYDKSELIQERLALLSTNAMTGVALVFVVLAIFLNLRVAFWVAAGLPFILCGTLYFMTEPYAGLTLNEMTTFGFIMALGIVVDDAVVVGESVYSTKKQLGDTVSNTITGVSIVTIPTLFGVLTTVAAFAALANVSGGLGVLYAQFGTIVTICLLLSVVESKLILPAHLAHLNTRQVNRSPVMVKWSKVQGVADKLLTQLNYRYYKPCLLVVLKHKYAALIAFVSILILAVSLLSNGYVRVGFFPSLPADTISASITLRNDASFGQTASNLTHLERSLFTAEQSLLHSAEQLDTSYIDHVAISAESDLSGQLDVSVEENPYYTLKELAAAWQQTTGLPEATKQINIRAELAMVSNFKVEIKTDNDTAMQQSAQAIVSYLQNIDGVSAIDNSLAPGEAQLDFTLSEQGKALGMTPSALSRQLLQTFGGEVVQSYMRGSDEVKVRARAPLSQRSDMFDVLNSDMSLPNGKIVPLSAVATIQYSDQVQSITRIGGVRAVTISAAVDKSKLTPVALVSDLKATLIPELTSSYHDLTIHFAGEAEHQAETTASMKSAYLLALFAIYALLAIPLKSYFQPLIIMAIIPFGFIGAILGHWYLDLTVSILSLNGILALSGVVINDSLLLVSQFNRYQKEGKPTTEAIVDAATGRLRAILLTSLTTFAGLYPILGESSQQAQFLIPAATSLGYGILFATLITLFMTPILLMISQQISAVYTKTGKYLGGEKVNDPHYSR
ncbi:efflux RND transporter permease subunit [Pseudoalteromonas piscicida]|uniref:efflux RND transporter permease subunit n=1 Tax=Pseudoalteromonas piscicida TaxID=43662 RepID=UPI00309A897F